MAGSKFEITVQTLTVPPQGRQEIRASRRLCPTPTAGINTMSSGGWHLGYRSWDVLPSKIIGYPRALYAGADKVTQQYNII